jgi:hypothetical protein
MKKSILLSLFILFILETTSIAEQFEAGNKIDAKIYITISYNLVTKFYRYQYNIQNSLKGEQNIWRFSVITSKEVDVSDLQRPAQWYKPDAGKGINLQISWAAPEGVDISPGSTMSGFAFSSTFLPGIIEYYTEGYHEPPSFPEGEAPDFVPGYTDLTPYGPGVVGKTIGPTAPPVDFKPLDFLNNIINMKHEAFKLGWIKNEGTLKSLDAKLDNAKKDIEKGNTRPAKNTLKAFINEVEAQGCASFENCPAGKHLTSEAYGLLKYNVQYLIDHL